MNATQILDQLKSARAVVRADDNDLFVDAPSSVLTDEFIEKLRQHKTELLELLSRDPRISAQPCPTCGGILLTESGDGWQRRWCPSADHRFSEFDGLGAFTGHAGRRKLEECLTRHECPECGDAMTLQDSAADAWFCAGCRLWAIEGKLQ